MLGGCITAFTGAPRPMVSNPSAELDTLRPMHNASVIMRCAQWLGPDNATALDAAGARECRNRILIARRYAIDLSFGVFEQAYFMQNNVGGFGATLAAVAIGTAGAFSGGNAARALAAGSSALAGGRAAYEREILAEQTSIALGAAMRGERDRISVRFIRGMSQTAEQYPLLVGLSDLEAYQRAGTVLGALTSLTQTVSSQAADAERRLEAVTANTPSSYLRSQYSRLQGPARDAQFAMLRDLAGRLRLPPLPESVDDFLNDETRGRDHEALAAQLGWQR
jgi:hypothetical protein